MAWIEGRRKVGRSGGSLGRLEVWTGHRAEESLLGLMDWLEYPRRDPWDCHRTADQARGGARGVNVGIYDHTWSVWVYCCN